MPFLKPLQRDLNDAYNYNNYYIACFCTLPTTVSHYCRSTVSLNTELFHAPHRTLTHEKKCMSVIQPKFDTNIIPFLY